LSSLQRFPHGERPATQASRGARAVVSLGSAVLALLADAGLLAGQTAQVVDLGATHVTARDDLDLVDDRRVHGEHALDAHLEADLADREGLAHAVALAAEHDALEDLDARAIALDDVDVDLDGVTGAELGDVAAERRLVDGIDDVHDESLPAAATGRP